MEQIAIYRSIEGLVELIKEAINRSGKGHQDCLVLFSPALWEAIFGYTYGNTVEDVDNATRVFGEEYDIIVNSSLKDYSAEMYTFGDDELQAFSMQINHSHKHMSYSTADW